jgi:hypothetical protein
MRLILKLLSARLREAGGHESGCGVPRISFAAQSLEPFNDGGLHTAFAHAASDSERPFFTYKTQRVYRCDASHKAGGGTQAQSIAIVIVVTDTPLFGHRSYWVAAVDGSRYREQINLSHPHPNLYEPRQSTSRAEI